VAANAASPVSAADPPPLQAIGIDHVSILVSDLQRSAKFYQDVFGMSPLSDDKNLRIQRFGAKRTIVSLRQETYSGVVDHVALGIDAFDEKAAAQELAKHGLTPKSNPQFGFHVKDPDGVNIQMICTCHRGY
jgi:catechol 2,3-dioxygenase-like lactoylglutathione lyase family enzyme